MAAGNYSRNYFEFNASATPTLAGLDAINMKVYNSTSVEINSTQTRGATFNYTNYTSMPDGWYYINATANDSALNTNTTVTRRIILDTTAPGYTFENPTPTNGVNYSRTYFDINMTFADNLMGIDKILIFVYANKTLYNVTTLGRVS